MTWKIAGDGPERAAARCSLVGVTALVLAAAAAFGPAMAEQPAKGKQTIAPFGSDMTVQKEKAASPGDAVQAIESSASDADAIKVMSKLDSVRIVHVGEFKNDAGKIAAAIKAHQSGIKDVQTAIEGNALTYAALNAQSLSVQQIVGARIGGNERHKIVTLYAQP